MSAHEQSTEEAEAADRRADGKAVLLIFTALVLIAVHFVSGWTFDF
ncbi:MAG: hypothetical protein RIB46_06665 [Pseudomonadales bacterium]